MCNVLQPLPEWKLLLPIMKKEHDDLERIVTMSSRMAGGGGKRYIYRLLKTNNNISFEFYPLLIKV